LTARVNLSLGFALIIMWLFPVILSLRQSSRAEIIHFLTTYDGKGLRYDCNDKATGN
jgi:hypothetical protein